MDVKNIPQALVIVAKMIIICKMDSVLNQAQVVNIKTVYAYLAWITFYLIILQINAK